MYMIRQVIYRDANAGAGGGGSGGGINIPLSEQGNPDDFWSKAAAGGLKQDANTNGKGVGGDAGVGGATSTPTLTDEQKKDITELEGLLNKDNATDQEKARITELKTKHEKVLNIEEVDETGTALTEEQKKKIEETNKRIKEIQAKPEGQRTVDDLNFIKANTTKQPSVYEKVDELRGEVIPVDYQGVDPSSPEGIFKREEAIADVAVEEYDAQLEKDYPLGYSFLKHLQAGGSPESFFKISNDDYIAINLNKTDTALQEKVFRSALASKGLLPAQIDALVTQSKDKGKLFEDSSQELEVLKANQKKQEAQNTAIVQQEQQRQDRTITGFINVLQDTVATKVDDIVIPVADRQNFIKDVASKVIYNKGRLFYTQEVTPQEINKFLSTQYFRFKGADLKGLVSRSAESLNTQNLEKKTRFKVGVRTSPEPVRREFKALGEI